MMTMAGGFESAAYDKNGDKYNITLCNVTFFIEPDDYILEDYALRVILALLVLIIFLLGTIGNLLVVAAVIFSKRLQNTTNVFVINLAVADFLTAILLPVHASTLLSQSSCYIPESLCWFVAAATLTTLGCSVITLAMIAFHRFTVLYAVLRPNPTFDNAFSKRNIVLMVMFTWVYPIVLMAIILPLDIGSLGYAVQYKVCAQNTTRHESDYLTLAVCLLVQFPAFAVIIVCYIYIFKMFRSHQRDMNAMMIRMSSTSSEINITIVEELPAEESDIPNCRATNDGFDECDGVRPASSEDRENLNEPTDTVTADLDSDKAVKHRENLTGSQRPPNRDSSITVSSSTVDSMPRTVHYPTHTRKQQNLRFKQQRQITINLFIVVCVYTICVMPSAIIYPIPSTGPAIPWLTILLLFNSCVNPIIYALRHPTFSEVLKCLIKCRYRDIPEPSSFLKSSSSTK